MKKTIGWKVVEDGKKVEIEANREKSRHWVFWRRAARAVRHEPYEATLEDWLQLLDAVERRVGRGLMKPKDVTDLENDILILFPAARLRQTTP